MKKAIINSSFMLCIIFLCSTVVGGAQAQQQAAGGAGEYTVERVRGRVAGLTKQSISVTFNEDAAAGTAEEILIPVDSSTTFKRVKSLDDLKKDDDVTVEYKKPDDGPIQALTISLMKAAPLTEFNRKPTSVERVKAEDKEREVEESMKEGSKEK